MMFSGSDISRQYRQSTVFRAESDSVDSVLIGLIAELHNELDEAWLVSSRKAIKDGLRALQSKDSAEAGLKAMSAALALRLGQEGVMSQAKRDELDKMISDVYLSMKKGYVESIDSKLKMGVMDKSVQASMGSYGPYWIGTFYDKQLSLRIQDIGQRYVVETGLGREEASKVMNEVLKEEFALRGGSSYESQIPGNFAGRASTYNMIVTANVASRTRSYSEIISLSDAGFERYEIVAVMDERTSEICQEMNGKEFMVKQGIGLVDQVINVQTPEEMKDVHPWLSYKDLKDLAEKGEGALAEAGLSLPPYHALCRTTISPL